MNRVIVMGRLVSDIELKTLESKKLNKLVGKFTLAIPHEYDRDSTDFLNCIAWEHTAEFISKYTGKGNRLLAEGRIESRKYETKEKKINTVWELKVEKVNLVDYKKQEETSKDELPFG